MQLLHQLAQGEVEEELFTAAKTTIFKALETDCTGAPDGSQIFEFGLMGSHMPNSAFTNPAISAGFSLDNNLSHTEAANALPLGWSLERMKETITPLAAGAAHCSLTVQIEQLSFRSRHERAIEKVVELADGLRVRALQKLAEEESKHGTRRFRFDNESTNKQGSGAPQSSRESAIQKPVLSWRGEQNIKRLIASFGCLVGRALEVGDTTSLARAATAILSMVQGTEKFVDATSMTSDFFKAGTLVDLRVALQPPLETEVVVNVIEAAYALVSTVHALL